MHFGTQRVTNPRQRAKGIGPRTEVSDAPQVFERMLFLADRVRFWIIYHPMNHNVIGLNFAILTLALGCHQLASD